MGLAHFLPSKIHSNFSSSDKISYFFAIPIISINAPQKNICFALLYPRSSLKLLI